MLLAEDQHAVGELGADGQHEAFGEACRTRVRATAGVIASVLIIVVLATVLYIVFKRKEWL